MYDSVRIAAENAHVPSFLFLQAGQPCKKETDVQQVKLNKRSVTEEAAAFLDSMQRPAEDDKSAGGCR